MALFIGIFFAEAVLSSSVEFWELLVERNIENTMTSLEWETILQMEFYLFIQHLDEVSFCIDLIVINIETDSPVPDVVSYLLNLEFFWFGGQCFWAKKIHNCWCRFITGDVDVFITQSRATNPCQQFRRRVFYLHATTAANVVEDAWVC